MDWNRFCIIVKDRNLEFELVHHSSFYRIMHIIGGVTWPGADKFILSRTDLFCWILRNI